MKTLSTFDTRAAGTRGVMLVEALVYISVLFVVLAVSGAAYCRVLDQTRQLRRVAADIPRALDAGERWRADVRATVAPPRLVEEESLQALHLPQRNLEVVYFFDGSNVVRRAGTNETWLPILPKVKASRFLEDRREQVTVWRWEIELQPGLRPPKKPPLFSFLAVPPNSPPP
jgi:hypothetical protein